MITKSNSDVVHKDMESKDLFTQEERNHFLKTIFYEEWFDSSFLYRGEAAELFNQLAESKYSTHYKVEKELLMEHRKDIQKFIGKNVTDFWCWDGEKANILLSGIGKNFNYIAADYSDEMIRKAQEKLKKNWSAEIWQNILLNGKSFTLWKEISENTYLWLWETMSNFKNSDIVNYLRGMWNTSYTKWNNIILSFAMEPKDEVEREQRKKIYDNALAEKFVMTALKQLWVDVDDFDYTVKMNESGDVLVWIIAKSDYELSLSNTETEPSTNISIKKGVFYPIHQNRAFNKESIDGLLKQARCDRKWIVDNQWVGLMVVQRLPEKWEKYWSKVRNTLLWLLLVWSGVGIKTGIDINKTMKEINIAKQEILKDKNMQNYGIMYDAIPWTADFNLAKKDLLMQVQNQSNLLYNDIMLIYSDSKVEDKQSILYLLQSELLNKQRNGGYVNIAKFNSDSQYRLQFLQSFLQNYRVLLANFGVNLLQPYPSVAWLSYDFSETLQLDGEIKWIMSVVDNRAIATLAWDLSFLVNKNTTIFAKEPLPSYLQKMVSDSSLMENRYWKVKFTMANEDFEKHKNTFFFKRTLGQYRHSDGRLFQLILVTKNFLSSSTALRKTYKLVFASDITTKEAQYTPAKEFSLSAWKEVLQDLQAYWLGDSNTN